MMFVDHDGVKTDLICERKLVEVFPVELLTQLRVIFAVGVDDPR